MKFPTWLNVYGDQTYRDKQCPRETAEQVTFFNRLRREYPSTYGRIALHPRNEGARTHHQAARHKAEGMTTGAADVIIPGAPALVLEIKRRDHTLSRWEDGQLEYLEAAQNAGAVVCVALGVEAAWDALQQWIGRQTG